MHTNGKTHEQVPDAEIRYYGTIATIELRSDAARAWWSRSVMAGQTWGGRQVIEPRFADDILGAMDEAGLVVVEGGAS